MQPNVELLLRVEEGVVGGVPELDAVSAPVVLPVGVPVALRLTLPVRRGRGGGRARGGGGSEGVLEGVS